MANNTKNPAYKCWQAMRDRCNNPNAENYYLYGGRGISICSQWDCFNQFLQDMGERPSPHHTIDRIDNNGNYTPGNCQWSLPFEQAHNRRRARKTNTGMVGVRFRNNTYTAQITHKGRHFHVGSFETAKDAASARNQYIEANNLPHKIQPLNGDRDE